jgi:hypothetical protein
MSFTSPPELSVRIIEHDEQKVKRRTGCYGFGASCWL